MKTIFENNDFILSSTEHYYDFVGIIETKTPEPLTFFFSEEMDENNEDGWDECFIDESRTMLIDVDSNHEDEEQAAMWLGADSYLRTRDDRSTGFLSDPRGRGQFLALVKCYCPEQLKNIPWA